MKKTTTLIAGLLLATTTINAQYNLAGFEDVVLPADSFYQDTTGADFTSSGTIFEYEWDQSFDYWSGGFSYSNMTDSVTSGYTNIYSAKTAVPYQGFNFAVGKSGAKLKFVSSLETSLFGFYVTNSTFAYNSMRDGDMFAKKFGGVTGNDPDWFKLVVRSYYGGVLTNDSTEFYLADFRFSDNSQDYIVNTWQLVNLSGFTSNADSVVFQLSSSDNSFGYMNTPAFFCMDNFESSSTVIGMKENGGTVVSIFPNPAKNEINISLAKPITIIGICSIVDVTGTVVRSLEMEGGTSSFKINVASLEQGVYFLRINTGGEVITEKFIKE